MHRPHAGLTLDRAAGLGFKLPTLAETNTGQAFGADPESDPVSGLTSGEMMGSGRSAAAARYLRKCHSGPRGNRKWNPTDSSFTWLSRQSEVAVDSSIA